MDEASEDDFNTDHYGHKVTDFRQAVFSQDPLKPSSPLGRHAWLRVHRTTQMEDRVFDIWNRLPDIDKRWNWGCVDTVKSATRKFGAKDQSVCSPKLSPLDVISFVK